MHLALGGRSAAVVFYFTARSLGQRWAFVVRARYFLILCVCVCVCVLVCVCACACLCVCVVHVVVAGGMAGFLKEKILNVLCLTTAGT